MRTVAAARMRRQTLVVARLLRPGLSRRGREARGSVMRSWLQLVMPRNVPGYVGLNADVAIDSSDALCGLSLLAWWNCCDVTCAHSEDWSANRQRTGVGRRRRRRGGARQSWLQLVMQMNVPR
jgi:hypothetical protein